MASINNDELQKQFELALQEINALKAQLDNSKLLLREREKELWCHNEINRLFDNPKTNPDEVFEKLINIIPKAFQYPEKATAFLSIHGKAYQSENFSDSKNALYTDVCLEDGYTGALKVCYQMEETRDNLFLSEEVDLLEVVAKRIADFVEKTLKQSKIEADEKKYQSLINSINEALIDVDALGIIQFASPLITQVLGRNADEITGFSFWDLMAEIERPRLNGIKDKLEKGEQLHEDVRMRYQYKQDKWIMVSANPKMTNSVYEGFSALLFDIDKIKKTNEALQKTELLYQSFIEASPDVITITDLEGNIKYVSPKVREMFGVAYQQAFENQNILSFIHPDQHELAKKGIASMFGDEHLGATEYQAYKADGSPFYIETNGEIIRDAQGEPSQMLFITRDVTARKTLETKLAETEIKFSNMYETMAQGVIFQDANGYIISCNPAAVELLGLTEDQMKGLTSTDPLWRALQADGTPFKPEDHPGIVALRTGKTVKNLVMGIYNPIKNTHVWLLVSSEPQFKKGESVPFQVFTTFTEITQQKESEAALRNSEQKLRIIADNTYHWEFWVGADGNAIYHSPACEKITGKPVDYFLNNSDWAEKLIHPDDREGYHLHHLDAFSIPSSRKYDFRIILADDSVKYIEHVCQPVFNDENTFLGIRGTNLDVTERKMAEIKLREREQELQNLLSTQTNYVLQTDMEGRHTYWNKKFEEEFSWVYPNNGLYLSNSIDSICSHHHQRTRETVEACFASPGKVIKVELDKPAKDGSIRTTLWEFVALVDANNNPTGIQCMGLDITDRRQAELALIQSEEKYRSLIDSSDSAIMMVDKNGYYTFLNAIAAMPFGKKPEELVGKHVRDLNPEWQVEEIMKNIQHVIETNEGMVIEPKTEIMGKTMWFRTSVQPVRDESGKAYAVLMYATNITEIKEAGEKIRKNERTLDLFVTHAPAAIAMFDTEMNYIAASQRYIKDFRLNETNLAGKSHYEIFPELGEERIAIHRRCLKGAMEKSEEDMLVRMDGSVDWVRWELLPWYDENDHIGGLMFFSEVITARKKAEDNIRKLSRAVEQSPVSIVITNLEGNIEYANAMACKITGYALEELLGQNPRLLKSGHTSESEYAEMWKTIIQGNDWKGVLKNKRKNGDLYWESATISPITDSNGNISHFIAIKEDITDHRRTEEELRKFRVISDQSNYGTAIAELDGKIIYVNEAFAEMHGWEIHELIGKQISIFHSERQLPRVSELLELIRLNGGFVAEEVGRVRKDGTEFPSLMNVKTIFDVNNQPMFMAASALDISELKASEEALRISEENLNHAQEIANMGSWVYNLKENKASWSNNYYRLIGHDPMLPPLSLEEIKLKVHPDDRHLFEQKAAQMQNNQQVDSIYFRLLMPDEKYKWIQSNMIPLFENDALVSIQGVSIDITEKREAEIRIKEQNDRLNAILKAMPDLIFVADNEGTIHEYYISDAKKAVLSLSEIIGTNISSLFPKKEAERQKSKINECLEKNTLVSYEYFVPIDGQYLFFEARLAPMEGNKVLSFVRDITERKQSESEIKKLTLAIEQSPVSIVITSLNAIIQYASPAFYQITGYTPAEVIGKNTNILKSGVTPDDVYKNMWKTIEAGKTWQGEWINKKKSGDLYWESIAITPISDETGRTTSYLAVKQDITERKYAEREILELNTSLERKVEERTKDLEQSNIALRKARIEADLANQSKSEFLSRMSHELRTPMNSILGFAQLLEMGQLNDSQRKGVSHIIRSGRHLLGLINEVLDISRIESGHISMSLEPVHLTNTITEVVDSVNPYAFSRNISIELIQNNSWNVYVKSDHQRLKQILINLINNAIKYNNEGGNVWIKVSEAKPGKSTQPFTRVSVIDDGFGIAEENISKLFRPFERIGAQNTEIEGSGLGLSVVKKLIELMGGRIGIESKPDEGSTFWFELPQSISELERVENTGELAVAQNGRKKILGTILYIEDNVSNIELVEQILVTSRSGINLITNMYGTQAVELAKQHKPTLILLDLNLPDIHGSEVLKMLHHDTETKHIPVIVISADAMPNQLDNLLRAGAKHYLTKPIEVTNFLKVIDEFIH
jgi:PAS domain S-box-containing protein